MKEILVKMSSEDGGGLRCWCQAGILGCSSASSRVNLLSFWGCP